MKCDKYQLEFITPCFCAGAVPERAEIRAPSIRGQLRWWFRVLGGSRDQEHSVFGGIDQASASSIQVRVRMIGKAEKFEVPQLLQNSHLSYLLYFAKSSQDGARWRREGALGVKSKFELFISHRYALSQENQMLWDLVLQAFLNLGTIGLRSSRGLGAFSATGKGICENSFDSLKAELEKKQISFHDFAVDCGRDRLLDNLGGALRALRSNWSANLPNPLGSSVPDRQRSAVHLRPIQIGPDSFRIKAFEVPHDRVLDRRSRTRGIRLESDVPEIGPPPRHDRRRR